MGQKVRHELVLGHVGVLAIRYACAVGLAEVLHVDMGRGLADSAQPRGHGGCPQWPVRGAGERDVYLISHRVTMSLANSNFVGVAGLNRLRRQPQPPRAMFRWVMMRWH